ncbi:MAG: YggS family pyridoxal phosphate-dependent enzyme [Bacteroidales bacterium]|nr:YggS family pyridoxal phosphate-dependent enzyme [Bacteroidales bacterium]
MENLNNFYNIKNTIPNDVLLLAVSKTKPEQDILNLYQIGQRDFGENKVQELTSKYNNLPKDINWHMIGHLQTNKVKYIVPFIFMIHSVDSYKLLIEINKHAEKNNRIINCLLQLKVANEETKFGFSQQEIINLFQQNAFENLKNIKIRGLMGMATNTEDINEIDKEFGNVNSLFNNIKANYKVGEEFNQISMGMSGDYKIAIKNGSTIIRIGSSIFGERDYSKI